jgi:hypothetical protein
MKKEFSEVYFSLNYTLMPDNCGNMLMFTTGARKRIITFLFKCLSKKRNKRFEWQNDVIEKIENQIDIITEKNGQRMQYK